MLVKAKLPKVKPLNTRSGVREVTRGVSRCNRGSGRRQCGACAYITRHPGEVVKELRMSSTGETLQIMDQINCRTRGCIYVLQSEKTPKTIWWSIGWTSWNQDNTARVRHRQWAGETCTTTLCSHK